MNYKKLFLAASVYISAIAAPAALLAQNCNIVQNSGFTNGTAAVFADINGVNMIPWVNNTGSPQLYPNTTIYMWDIGGNGESIRQQLCNPIVVGPFIPQVNLSIDAQTNANNNGVMQVLLSDGVNSFPIFTTALTPAMTTYNATNVAALLPPGNYNRIIIRPIGNLPNARMDIIIDNVILSAPGITAVGTRYTVDMVCCQPGVLTYPGLVVIGDLPPQWISMETGAVLGTGNTLNVTPGKSGATYLFRQFSNNCAGNPCQFSEDTVVVRCCGGDDDWLFSDPTRITSVDQIHRTGDVNVGNIAIVAGAPDIAKVEIKHNDNSRWGQFILNGAGNGRMLRLKGGFFNGQHSIFQVEANGATDYTEDNVRLMVRADGRVGINTTTPRGALDVNGTAWCTSGTWSGSDRRYKQNIEQVTDPLSLVMKIKGYRYDFRRDEFPAANFREGTQLGLIAQELQEVLPEAVATGDDGYLAVNYDMIVPVLVEAVKDLKKEIDVLRNQLAQLQGTDIKGGVDAGIPGAVLYQNVPNPFNGNTEIAYELPEDVTGATVDIYDMIGKTLSSTPVKAGKGSISITANELAPGVYLYSLSGNGRVIDTKRMVITK